MQGLSFLRREAECERKHDAATGEDADVILAVDRDDAGGVEGVGVGGAVGRDGCSGDAVGERDAESRRRNQQCVR